MRWSRSFQLRNSDGRNPVRFLPEWRYHLQRIISERLVKSTATHFYCPQTPAALVISVDAARIAKAVGWVDLAPPGSFG